MVVEQQFCSQHWLPYRHRSCHFRRAAHHNLHSDSFLTLYCSFYIPHKIHKLDCLVLIISACSCLTKLGILILQLYLFPLVLSRTPPMLLIYLKYLDLKHLLSISFHRCRLTRKFLQLSIFWYRFHICSLLCILCGYLHLTQHQVLNQPCKPWLAYLPSFLCGTDLIVNMGGGGW